MDYRDEQRAKCREYLQRYKGVVPNFPRFLETMESYPPEYIRINVLRTGAEELRQNLNEQGVETEGTVIEGTYKIAKGRASKAMEYGLGHYFIQDLASNVPALALGPKKGDLVVDLCAAPGGKTTHMAELMDNRGRLVANDPSGPRLNVLVSHLSRLGIINTAVTKYDGRGHPLLKKADKVLVDAPCSSEGTMRKNWNVADDMDREGRKRLAAIQKGLLTNAVERVKKGTIIVYSTCTFAPEENEAVVRHALEGGDATLLPIDIDLEHSPGLRNWESGGEGFEFGEELERCVRIYPHQNDTGGMFVANIQKL